MGSMSGVTGHMRLLLVRVLPILLAKKRHHFLTVEYSDDTGKTQAAIFEVGKESIRSVLKILEVRSGKKVQYEDKEAEKTGNKQHSFSSATKISDHTQNCCRRVCE